MPIQCPGALNLRLDVVLCPECGSELELFTDEYKTTCQNCGKVVFRDLAACIDWCPYARKCLAEREKYKGAGTPIVDVRKAERS
ncbi:MAG: phosphohydrolase [Candidatus Bathyarchaeia archaeon]